jgi:hypothetical protein
VTQSLDLARRMIILADEAEAGDVDDGCVLLCGILRDCAYRMKRQAESEKRLMQGMRRWEDSPAGEAATVAE